MTGSDKYAGGEGARRVVIIAKRIPGADPIFPPHFMEMQSVMILVASHRLNLNFLSTVTPSI